MYKLIILVLLIVVMILFGGCRGVLESEYLKLFSVRQNVFCNYVVSLLINLKSELIRMVMMGFIVLFLLFKFRV